MTEAFALFAAKTDLAPWSFEQPHLKPCDIEIQITHCGLCHTDLHFIEGDFGDVSSRLPLVLGHEIIGTVTKIGSDVLTFKLGDRVGVGPNASNCGSCSSCTINNSQVYCAQGGSTYGFDLPEGKISQGGLSRLHRTDARWAFSVPPELSSAGAAPLFCAGIAVFSPLNELMLSPHRPHHARVAVVGLGGLGHLAVKIASAMGAPVTVLSTSAHKEEAALRLGGSRFVVVPKNAASDASQVDLLSSLSSSFDLVLNTAPHMLSTNLLLGMVAPRGTLVQLASAGAPLQIDADLLIMGGRRLAGSMTGSPEDYRAMLAFCGQHRIESDVELFAFNEVDVNRAIHRLRSNDLRYRAVVQMSQD